MRSIEQFFDSGRRRGLSVGASTTAGAGQFHPIQEVSMSSIAMSGALRPASAGSRPTGELRLTRRGRLAVFLACLALVCVALMLASGAATGSGEPGEPVPTRVVTVQPGDTLWAIASRAAPGEDPRDTIEQIQDLNAIGSSLQSGQKIHVPVSR